MCCVLPLRLIFFSRDKEKKEGFAEPLILDQGIVKCGREFSQCQPTLHKEYDTQDNLVVIYFNPSTRRLRSLRHQELSQPFTAAARVISSFRKSLFTLMYLLVLCSALFILSLFIVFSTFPTGVSCTLLMTKKFNNRSKFQQREFSQKEDSSHIFFEVLASRLTTFIIRWRQYQYNMSS